jgi:hypothetical protein
VRREVVDPVVHVVQDVLDGWGRGGFHTHFSVTSHPGIAAHRISK